MNHGTTLETTTKNMKQYYFNNITLVIFSFALSLLVGTSAAQCSKDGPLCPDGMCCSIHGWCGYSEDYCGPGNCQSQCPSPPPPSPPPPPYAPPPPISPEDVSNIITEEIFEEMLTYRNDPRCKSNFFYTYEAFLTAARRFPAFGTTGSLENRTRELASFFAQTAHETNGGWPTAEGGPYAWGYCYIREKDPEGDYCSPNVEWPCVPGQQYYGRGPIQLSHNYNYGPAGEYFGLDLLTSPDLIATDSVLSFETAIWFWMTPQGNKPSCHDVAIGAWTPTPADLAANRLPGYGVITNIINGGKECGKGYVVPQEENRIGYYNRFCQILGVNLGDNIDCSNQKNFGDGLMNPRYGVIRMPVY